LFESPALQSRRETISTPDDDFLDLDILESEQAPITLVLFHGLEGSSKRYYITRMAQSAHNRGWNVVAANWRGCSGRLNSQKRFYHSGEIKDPETILNWVQNRFPNTDISGAGFSLGASALLNYLAEKGTNTPLSSFTAISTPFDLKSGSLLLEKGFNRIYNHYFLTSLKEKLKVKSTLTSDMPAFSGKTLYEFDDKVTAPLHGFENAEHYYRACSSGKKLEHIKIPVLLIHSKEDPICPYTDIPINVVADNPNLNLIATEKGGHVGFWSLPPGWIETTTCDYIEKITDQV
jgi:predicted alpha/beta-fold hydrolase